MRRVNIVFFLLISLTASAALKTEKFSISFSESDFLLSYDDDGCMVIESVKASFYPETNEPALPLFSTDIAVSGNSSYISSAPKYTKRLIRSDVRMAQCPIPMPTDGSSGLSVSHPEPYALAVYPASNCNYVSFGEWGDINVLHFLACPFVYDAKERNLYFIDSIELDVTLDDGVADTSMKYKRTERAILKNIVMNAGAIDSLLSMQPAAHNDIRDRLDYVIITKRSLVSSFEPLLQWKKRKGLYSKIITMEDIESEYTGADIQVKLKNCLYDLYSNNELRYVLLGGDDTVVPVRGCYGEVKTTAKNYIDHTIPTDLYYACFGRNFEWDGNGNGIYGEPDDNINLAPSIYVTRVPVRTSKDVTAFVDKLLCYEKGQHWNNNILMCGNRLLDPIPTNKPYEAEARGDELYSKYIKPYWDGTRVKFYDTYTDFPTGADYDLSPENLKEQLSMGYSFMDMITHGFQTIWSTEIGYYYSIFDGIEQKNSGSTIITTTACSTNAFDSSDEVGHADPCLSESLIRNPSSGIIAYLGCSRKNWFHQSLISNSPDIEYESEYYKKLFSNSMDCYGSIVASAKAALISKSSSSDSGSYRWIQFGLNPIGDPEMPVYISAPKQFDAFEFIHTDHLITINTGGPRCRICIMSADDDGASYYEVYDGVQYMSLPDTIPVNFIISITSQGYIPTFYKVCYIQGETISYDKVYDCDIAKVGNCLTNQTPIGDVVIKDGKTTINASDAIIYSITVEKGAELIINNKK